MTKEYTTYGVLALLERTFNNLLVRPKFTSKAMFFKKTNEHIEYAKDSVVFKIFCEVMCLDYLESKQKIIDTNLKYQKEWERWK